MKDKCLRQKLNSVLNCMDLKRNLYSSLLIKCEVQVMLLHLWSLKEQKVTRYLSYVFSLPPTI